MGNSLSLIASIGVPLITGTAIGISMRDDVKSWYPTIKKPSWNPPNWIFGPVWTCLYATIGYASWRVFQAGGGPLPLGLYATQLALNFIWTPLFFKAHNLKAASYEITALLGTIVATIMAFNKVDETAALLMLPYLGWTTFATCLTWNIHLNNPDQPKKE
ncbi:hypothetical protein Ndes2526B_g05897 [Nannochloris sp. 'desiccata']